MEQYLILIREINIYNQLLRIEDFQVLKLIKLKNNMKYFMAGWLDDYKIVMMRLNFIIIALFNNKKPPLS